MQTKKLEHQNRETIAAIVTDSKSNPLSNSKYNLKIYSNGILNGSADEDGSRLQLRRIKW